MYWQKVSIIILNWNGLEDTIECLESLKKIAYPYYEVIVVDNASEGDDVRILREKFGDYIYMIENDKNYGFAEGNNIGIRHVLGKDTDYVFLLNNDTIVDPEFLSELINVAEADRRIGIICPMIYYYDQPDRVWFGRGLKVDLYRGICTEMRKKESSQLVVASEVVTGTAMLIRRETLETVGLLPQHFFGVEDIDYSLAVLRAALRIGVVPKARVWHKGSRSVDHNVGVARVGYHYRGWQVMRRKYLTTTGYVVATFCSLIWAILRSVIPLVRYLYRGDFREVRNFFRKVVQALKGTIAGLSWRSKER